jgi:hypothetical protein
MKPVSKVIEVKESRLRRKVVVKMEVKFVDCVSEMQNGQIFWKL